MFYIFYCFKLKIKFNIFYFIFLKVKCLFPENDTGMKSFSYKKEKEDSSSKGPAQDLLFFKVFYSYFYNIIR